MEPVTRYWVTNCEWHSDLKEDESDDGRDTDVVLAAVYDAKTEQLRQARAKAVEMARGYQATLRATIENESPYLIGSPECERLITQDPRWQAAQAVIAEWGGVMKVYAEILSLENQGDDIRVTCQGLAKRHADWRPMQRWSFTVPDFIGKRYQLGQRLKIEVKP